MSSYLTRQWRDRVELGPVDSWTGSDEASTRSRRRYRGRASRVELGPVDSWTSSDEAARARPHPRSWRRCTTTHPRNRLLQFQLQFRPQRQSPGAAEQLGSGIVGAAILIEMGTKSLGVCLDIAARNGVPPSLPRALAALEDQELFDRLLALRLPRRPVTQAHAFARVEAAVYAIYGVMLNIQRCVNLLGSIAHPAAAATDASSQDPVVAATEHLAKIGLSDPDAAVTEPTPLDRSNIGPASAVTGEPLSQETSGSVDLDQARACLDRACTLASLAVKHVDLAVTAISSCVDPKEVARPPTRALEVARMLSGSVQARFAHRRA